MNEWMTERLSRLIDGDLDAAENEDLRQGIESDHALRREHDGLKRVRQALHELADREQPPPELDALVDPLLRGRPEAGSGRRWSRWLAAAAVVVLGVTVVLEVQRREPDPALGSWQDRALEGAAAEPTQGFSLAPLPTSSAPESRPRGAADRLVSAPEAEVDSTLEPAPALEVMGPLGTGKVDERSPGTDRGLEDASEESAAPARDHEKSAAGVRPSQSSVAPAPATGRPEPAAADSPPLASAQSGREDSGAAIAGAQLFVFMESETAWRAFEPDRPCEAGRYALRIRVKDGVISEVWPVANPPAPTRQVRASQLVLGLEVDDVADGEYPAEVVVEPRRATNR